MTQFLCECMTEEALVSQRRNHDVEGPWVWPFDELTYQLSGRGGDTPLRNASVSAWQISNDCQVAHALSANGRDSMSQSWALVSKAEVSAAERWAKASSISASGHTAKICGWAPAQVPKWMFAVVRRVEEGGSGTIFFIWRSL